MDYDIEREKQKSEEIRIAMRECFPLVPEELLPWAACQIKDFLRGRIVSEIEKGMAGATLQIARVLCEVTHPKSHLVDMCRNVVNQAKESAGLAESVARLREKIKELQDEIKELKNG